MALDIENKIYEKGNLAKSDVSGLSNLNLIFLQTEFVYQLNPGKSSVICNSVFTLCFATGSNTKEAFA